MSNLIEELKKEHLEIIDTIQSAFDKGLLHDGRDVLLSAKNMLISHIKKEDKDLYTPLRENAEHDENFKIALDILKSNMEELSQEAIRFFDKFSEEGNSREFVREYKGLLKKLTERIQKEENILFAEYNKRIKKI